ncbi:lanosterol 14-alpha-demethylase [Rhizoctonia solani AG-3 Rhs1AP]|uniref:Lanosterol 14-alpha-demethylase n=2 Tax=Rhizoctonia solani AG-3 TaxID=1086053 RepID=A0A074RYN5_9AGAM|nr:lanosterol 14-alpha-demethylase [Rhizoctonia solani AG-3 Rhs1AP]KEP49718.1 lanosterol 14-alpha-demethylase [Rhizoctonia solani 123E]
MNHFASHLWLEYVMLPPLLDTSYAILMASCVCIALNVITQLVMPADPSLPPQVFYTLPYIGSAIEYGNDPVGFLSACRKKYGDVFTFVLLGRRMTVAVGPKGSNFVLGGKLSQVSAEEAYTHLTTPVFGKGVVFDVPNHVFMEQKKFIKSGLTTESLRAYVNMIFEETTTFLHKDLADACCEKEWGRFPVLDTVAGLTILTASRTLQGKEVRLSLDKTFSQVYKDLDGGFTPLNFMFANLPLPSYWRRDRAQQRMSDFYVKIIENRRKENREDEYDMISALASKEYKDGSPLGDREIAHMMIALLMAGQHTSSSTSSWALLHLADRPDVAKQLLEEQETVLGNEDGSLRPLTYEGLQKLPVLNSVIHETLRIHPPIHSIMRKCIDDIVVPASLASPSSNSTYIIPKGHFLLASPALSQVDPNVWSNASEWDPSRWLDPNGAAAKAESLYMGDQGEKVDYGWGMVSKGTESSYQPFGAGRHRCIGEKFAYVQLGTILSTVVRTIEMKLDSEVPAHNYHTMIVQPKGPCMIQFRFRDRQKE